MNHQSIVRIGLDQLVIRENSKRHSDAVKKERLKYNLKSIGQINPLLVEPIPELEKYGIIAGAMRYLALLEANEPDAACLVVDRQLSEAQFLELVISENLQRFDPDAMEFARRVMRYIEASGLSATDAAIRLGMTGTEISRCRERVYEWPEELQLLVENGLPPSTGHGIHKIEVPEKRQEAMRLAAEGKLSRDVAWSWAKESKSGRPPAARKNSVERIKASLDKGTVTITGAELDSTIVVEMLTTLLRQARRAVSQGVTEAGSLFSTPTASTPRKRRTLAQDRAPASCQ